MKEIFLLYNATASLLILTGLHPFICIFITLSISYTTLSTPLVFCASIAAVFFAAMLQKTNKQLTRNLRYLWTIPVYLYIGSRIYYPLAAAVLLFMDYASLDRFVYQQKTYNRILLYLVLVLWNTLAVDQAIAITLGLAVGHGLFLHYYYYNQS